MLRRLAAVVWMVLKRMSSNIRTVLSLLVGLVLAVGVVSSISVYTDGSLQNALIDTLTNRSNLSQTQVSGTSLFFQWQLPPLSSSTLQQYENADQVLSTNVPKKIGLPLLSYTAYGISQPASLVPVDVKKDDVTVLRTASFGFSQGLEKHIRVIGGKWPAATPSDGATPVLVYAGLLDTMEMNVGDEFYYPLAAVPGAPSIKVVIAGAFNADQNTDPYFAPLQGAMNTTLFVPQSTYLNIIQKHIAFLQSQEYGWYFNFDVNKLNFSQVPSMITAIAQLKTNAAQVLPGTSVASDPTQLLQKFEGEQGYLQIMLLVLSIPIFFIIVYYIMLAANLVLERQRTEMAVLRSRGGNGPQILGSFTLELSLIGIAALVVGPLLGAFLAKMMGATNGFLSFVGRKPLPIHYSFTTFEWALVTVVFAILTSIIPAFRTIKTSIVTQKQELARSTRSPLWQRYFLDVLFLLLTLYGYYALQTQQLANLTGGGSDAGFNWTLFVVPGLFVFAVGLVCLRLFPYFIRLLTWLLSPLFGVSVTMAMRQIARMPGSYRPLVLLLIVTIAFGSYSATAAHTLDTNMVDRNEYKYGADVQFTADWQTSTIKPTSALSSASSPGTTGGGSAASADGSNTPAANLPLGTAYVEPPFKWYQKAPGVIAAARVYTDTAFAHMGTQDRGQGNLMAIDPAEFAQVVWFRKDLAPENLGIYLEALATHQNGVICSKQYMMEQGLKLGDVLTLGTDYGQADFEIVGQIDYWPSLYEAQSPFFITNLAYFQDEVGIRPYAVWAKLQPTAPVSGVVSYLHRHGVDVTVSADARQAIVDARRDPSWTGMVGVLTIGFLTALAVTILGFWLYAFLSLRTRFPQFGALRALGLSVRQLITVIVAELAATMGLGILIGTGTGVLTGNLFLPFLQFGNSSLEYQVPPFEVIGSAADLVRIYWILGILLCLTFISLIYVLTRMKIHQAVKLGEEA